MPPLIMLVKGSPALMLRAALDGFGLSYVLEPEARPYLERGELAAVLTDFAPEVPRLFLYFPRGAARQPKLRAFIDTARRVLPGLKASRGKR